MLLLLLSCTPAPPDSATDSPTDSTPSGDSDPQNQDSGDTDDVSPDAPRLETCDAWCYLHQTGEENWVWRLECTASDPQGVETTANGRVEIQQDQATFAEDLVACDSSGFCSTQFGEPTHDVWCDQASSYTFLVFVSDVDEHESAPYVVKGRKE